MTVVETKAMTDEQPILAETDGHVGIIRLNRPKVLNALNPELMEQLAAQLEAYDRDDDVYVIVLTGNDRAFAAGADIADMADRSMLEILTSSILPSMAQRYVLAPGFAQPIRHSSWLYSLAAVPGVKMLGTQS